MKDQELCDKYAGLAMAAMLSNSETYAAARACAKDAGRDAAEFLASSSFGYAAAMMEYRAKLMAKK